MKFLISILAFSLIDCLQARDSHSLTEGELLQKYLEEISQSGYNTQIKPESSSGPGKPIDIACTMQFLDIHKMDDTNMEYRAQFYFTQSWKDSRLAFPDLNISSIQLNDAKYIWTPDVSFTYERDYNLHKLINPNMFIKINKKGVVLFSFRMSLTFRCNMDFRKYPHDSQNCSSYILSNVYTHGELDLTWFDGQPNLSMGKTIDLLPFRVEEIRKRRNIHSYNLTDYDAAISYSYLMVDVVLERKAGFFVTRLYIPYIFLVILSWLSFLIPAKLLAPRLTLLLVVLYLMENIGKDINGQVPKTSYAKGSDVWIAVCESLVFASILEFIASHILSKNKVELQKGTCEIDTEDLRDLNSDSKINPVSKAMSINAVIMIVNRLKRDIFLSRRIDRVSSFLFPVMFIFFNFVYWITYCIGN